jgi:hypothetical protein
VQFTEVPTLQACFAMAHIVDATPSSSAGAAQLFAAAAALEDGNEDATDYSSINR